MKILKIKYIQYIFIGISILISPSLSQAATVYVSQSTANNYSIGSDANSYIQSQSKSTPKLTLRGATAVVQDGDTIVINDGTYSEYDYVYFNDPNITVNAENAYSAIIQNATSSATRIIHQANQASNLTLGKIILDGNNDEQYCYTSDSGTNTNGLTINGTKCLNPTIGFIQGWTKLYNITMQNNWILEMSSTSNLACIEVKPPVAGSISITDGTITVTSTTDASSKCISVLPSVSNVPIVISNVSITQTGDGTNIVNGIYLKGGSTYNVNNNTINISNAATPKGIEIHNHDTLTASNADVYNNSGTLNSSSGGYLILVGDDGTPTTSNTISGIDIYNNNFTGANHGYVLGHVTGGRVYNNIAKNVAIGVLGKETTSSQFYYNIINNVVSLSGGLRSKGGTNDVFYNNTVYIPSGSAGRPILVNINDTTSTNSTGIVFKNNIITTIDTQPMVDINTNNTATFLNDLFYSESGLASNSWIYQGTNYPTLSSWQTAQESTAQHADPLFASSTPSLATGFILQSLSPAIDAGTDVSLTTDILGNPIYGTPDLGAYEYQPSYTIGTNNIELTGETRIYADGKYRYTTATTSATTADLTITPLGGSYYTANYSQYMDLTIDTWSTTGDQNKQWTATSTAGNFLTLATTTVYTVGDLLANTYYQFKIDGTASSTAVTGSTCNASGACKSDSSGNLTFNYIGGYSTHTFALERDTTSPASFNLSSPTNNANATNNQPTFSWNASSDASSGISKYQLYVDGSLDTDNISGTSATISNSLSCGEHSWYVVAVDNDGNTTNTDTRTLKQACGGGIFTGSVKDLPGYIKPRLQTIQPDGTIVYHDEVGTLTDIPTTEKVVALPVAEVLPKIQFSSYLQIGNRNNEVSLLQQILRELGFFIYPENTGYFGTVTKEAVKAFQENNEIETVGVVGPKTRAVLNNIPIQPTTISPVHTFTKYLTIGETGEEVMKLQQKLRELGFFAYPENTGYFGSITSEAVKDFQRNRGIEPVGVVGPKTRAVLNAR